jgi:hypothetical protein
LSESRIQRITQMTRIVRANPCNPFIRANP